jgi:hypothetical protein
VHAADAPQQQRLRTVGWVLAAVAAVAALDWIAIIAGLRAPEMEATGLPAWFDAVPVRGVGSGHGRGPGDAGRLVRGRRTRPHGGTSAPGRARHSPSCNAWVSELGTVDTVGIEGTGPYGAGLCRWLRERGVVVVEVERPERKR